MENKDIIIQLLEIYYKKYNKLKEKNKLLKEKNNELEIKYNELEIKYNELYNYLKNEDGIHEIQKKYLLEK